MIIFPPKSIITVPPAFHLEGESSVLLYSRMSAPELKEAGDYYGSRIKGLSLKVEDLNNLDIPESMKRIPLQLNIRGGDLVMLNRNIGKLKRKRVSVRIIPDGNARKLINFLTGFKFVPLLDASVETLEVEILPELWYFYLHNQLLNVPVQPFHSILITKGRNRGPGMWDLTRERPGIWFFIDGDGNISISEQRMEKGVCFGNIRDTYETVQADPAFTEIIQFNQTVFEEEMECMYCPHMPVCKAFFKRYDCTADCSPWRNVFDMMDGEISRVRKMAEEYDGNP